MAYTYDLTTPETVTRRPGMPPEGTSVDHTVSQTTLTPVNSKYIPGTMLTGVMNQANLIIGNYNNTSKFGLGPSKITTDSPETQQAAVSAVNNSSFNLDAPEVYQVKTFDKDAKFREMYGTNASRRDRRRFERYWDSDQRWTDQNAFERAEHEKQMQSWDARFNAIKQQNATNHQAWLKEVNSKPLVQTPLLTEGLDFNDTEAVLQWLADKLLYKHDIDGLYGANTKAAIDELLSSDKFVLTQAEKDAFRNFQNNATFVRAKQPAKVETPAQSVVSNLAATPPVIDPEKQKRIDAYMGAGYIKRLNNGLTYYVDPKTKISYFDDGRVARNNTLGTVQEDGSIIWDNFNFNNFGLDNNLKYTEIGGRKYLRWDPSGHGDFYVDENGKIHRVRIGGGLGDEITSFTSDLQMANYADLYNKMHPEKPARIVNGVLIKKHQQGGNMEQQEQQEFMKFLIEDALAQGLQIQTEDDVKSYLSQLGEEGIKAKYLQFMQMKGQTPSAKLGSKLNYIKSLKGDCPDDEEVVYFKKGGMICKACEKKKQGAKLEQSKINPVEEFKKGRKTKKC